MAQFITSLARIAPILLSTGKRRIRLSVVGAAFGLQALIAFLVLATSWGRAVIQGMSNGVAALLSYADAMVAGSGEVALPKTRISGSGQRVAGRGGRIVWLSRSQLPANIGLCLCPGDVPDRHPTGRGHHV